MPDTMPNLKESILRLYSLECLLKSIGEAIANGATPSAVNDGVESIKLAASLVGEIGGQLETDFLMAKID